MVNLISKEYPSMYIGTYEYSDGGPIIQNSLHVKYPVEWLIIDYDVENRKMLLLSKYIIETNGYADCPILGHGYETSWETSFIRKWLNHDFYDRVFTYDEKALICPTYISPEKKGQRKTLDNLFLLGEKEYYQYFKEKSSKAYMYYSSCKNDKDICLYIEPWPWWLRNHGPQMDLIKYVDREGSVDYQDSNCDETGIRPAMWIKAAEQF